MSCKHYEIVLVIAGIVLAGPLCLAQTNDAERALIDEARQQLARPYLARPLPCFDPWLAGDDNRVVAVPASALAEGLQPGDILTSIGGRRLVAGEVDGWLHAMRALPKGSKTFDVTVLRKGRDITLRLSCTSHAPYFEAERRVWASITSRNWNECAAATLAAMQAFGKNTSAMMEIRLRCATAGKWAAPQLREMLHDYAVTLVDEMPARSPAERPSIREMVLDIVRALEKAGAATFATELRDRLAQAQAEPAETQGVGLTESQLLQGARAIAVGYGFDPDTPKGQVVQAWARGLFSEPLVLAHLFKIQRDEDPVSWARQMVEEGVPFLPDLYLKRRMEIVLRMLQAASATECAQITVHPRYGRNDQGAALRAVLPRLDDTDVAGFFEVLREAMMVRLRQREFVPYAMAQEEAEGVFVLIAEAVPTSERDRWISQLQRVDSLTDSAYCEASKTLYRATLTLTGPNASRGLRLEFIK
jgi:hypothetical protein